MGRYPGRPAGDRMPQPKPKHLTPGPTVQHRGVEPNTARTKGQEISQEHKRGGNRGSSRT